MCSTAAEAAGAAKTSALVVVFAPHGPSLLGIAGGGIYFAVLSLQHLPCHSPAC